MRRALEPFLALLMALFHALCAVFWAESSGERWALIGAASWAGIAAHLSARLYLLETDQRTGRPHEWRSDSDG